MTKTISIIGNQDGADNPDLANVSSIDAESTCHDGFVILLCCRWV